MTLPTVLYDTAAVRALDACAIDTHGIPGLELMTRAGEAAWQVLRVRWPRARRVVVFCGQGNNAGDGYVLARCAHEANYQVSVVQVGDAQRLRGDARLCWESMVAAGVRPAVGGEAADVIVDALLGTGLDRDVGGRYLESIRAINAQTCPVLSIDVPSGVNATTGQCMGEAVAADVTITFIGVKQGLLTGAAPDFTGDIVFDDLGVPGEVYEQIPATAGRLEFNAIRGCLRRRRRTAHKGDHGHVLVVGGAPGYSGALRMAAEAAGRVGAGLLSVAAHPDTVSSVNITRPEIMAHAVSRPAQLDALVKRASVIVVGPGLGTSDWAVSLLSHLRAVKGPLVVDADALNLLGADPESRSDWVLTPHPGEAARLLGVDTASIQGDRVSAARALVERYGGTIVLKGAGTIVMRGGSIPEILTGGNPGMGTGGMGDVLSGIIAGLIAQGLDPYEAARVGCCVHVHAGDRAAADGERGMLATDLMPYIRAAVN